MGPLPELPAIDYAERSDPGRDPDKQVNEDVCAHRATRFGHLCVVCDGMGGHAAGREAAELAVGTVLEVFDKAADEIAPGLLLQQAVEEASRRVHEMRTSEVALGRPGATAVAILLHARGTEVVHVGDSRAYLVHQGQIARITRDHSVVQELVDRGLLAQEQASHHPEANRITRALGMRPEVDAELRPQPVVHAAGDTFLLCSDGLSDLVDDAEILALVATEPPAQAAGKLVDLANARGGHDNITVVIARARESALAPTVGVLPTVPQTRATQPLVAAPLAAAPTLVESAAKTQPGAPLGAVLTAPSPTHIPPAPAPTPLAPPAPHKPAQRKASPVVLLGIVLGLAAFAMLAVVLFGHILERGGKRNATPPPLSTTSTPAAPALSMAPTVEPPTPTASPEPIAPLEPSPAPTKKR